MARKRNIEDILEEMRKIAFPGDYGLGSEPDSVPDDDKKAWERMGELIEEAQEAREEECANEDEDELEEPEDYDLDFDGSRLEFADPGGNSSLRAASKSNPRNLPCPTCRRPNRLTRKDKALGYQCNSCADAVERGYDIDYGC